MLSYTKTPWLETYSEIIDVRSEDEYAEDHLPGAINLPVLNNEERAKVGTIYKQIAPFEGRKIGAALVSRNISLHLEKYFYHKNKSYFPLIYCWRGGQRSNSLALVLSQIGWRVNIIEGGYQTYRTYVRQELDNLCLKFNYQILAGLTGTGKTYILKKIAERGIQILDLEALANHRGSLLGERIYELQPSQKMFESLLLQKLKTFNVEQDIWLESESNKIGQLHLPKVLWEKMKQGKCLEINLPKEFRINLILEEYQHLLKNPDILTKKLTILKSRYGTKKIQEWYELIKNKNWSQLVDNLLTYHYDPAYQRSLGKIYQNLETQLTLPDLSPSSINKILTTIRR